MVRLAHAAVAAAAAAAASAASTASTQGAPDACASCQAQVGQLAAISNNATAVAGWVAGLQANCSTAYPSDPTQRALCDAVASAAGGALPWLAKQLGTLAYDPLAVCSVFVPVCTQPCCDDPTGVAPEQLHLSLTGSDMSQMGVSWVTLNETGDSTVQWGPAPPSGGCDEGTPLPSSAAGGPTRTYTFGGWVGRVHYAVMTQLAPGTSFCYRVGSAGAGAWSAPVGFATPPADVGLPGGPPLVLVQTGDMGGGANSNATVAALTALAAAPPQRRPHLWLLVGDVSYDDGYAHHFDVFMRKVAPIAATIPLMVVRGNHESVWQGGVALRTRFTMPQPANATAPPGDELFYSLRVGPLHLVMTDTETDFDTADMSDAQVAWVAADLAGVDRAATPWVVAAGHRPLYCTDKSNAEQCGGFAAWLRGKVEATYVAAGVDVVVGAHEHGYERTWRVVNGSVTSTSYAGAGAPVYIINGAAGNREGNELPAGDAPWSAAQNADFGYSVVSLSAGGGGANATLQWVHYRAPPPGEGDPVAVDSWGISK